MSLRNETSRLAVLTWHPRVELLKKSDRLYFEFDGRPVEVEVDDNARHFGIWTWNDGSKWEVNYREGSDACLLHSDREIYKRATSTSTWTTQDANYKDVLVTHHMRLRGRTIYYSLADGAELGVFRFKWFTQPCTIQVPASYSFLVPVILGDLVTAIHWSD